MKVVYFASDPIAVPVLEWLGGRVSPADLLVVAGPDTRSGRGRKLRRNAVAEAGDRLGIEVVQPEKPDRELADRLRTGDFRHGFVFAYGHILRKTLLDAFAGNLLNFHGSLLPRYRGASPVETAIAMGDPATGVSLMRVVRLMDAGPVAAVERVPVRPGVTGPELRAELAEAAVRLLKRSWEDYLAGALAFVEQEESQATYVRRLHKEDGWIDFHLSAEEIERRARAFAGWPGAFFEVTANDEPTRIKVEQVRVFDEETTGDPGRVLAASTDGLIVSSGKGAVGFGQLQRPGGKMVPAGDFLRGFPIQEGERLTGSPGTEALVRRQLD